jgi:hypothetical protein
MLLWPSRIYSAGRQRAYFPSIFWSRLSRKKGTSKNKSSLHGGSDAATSLGERRMIKVVVDAEGIAWKLRLSIQRIEDIAAATGVNILTQEFGERIMQGRFEWKEVPWLLCAPEAKKLGIETRAQFLDRFETFEILKAGREVFESFFQSAATATANIMPNAAE